MAVEIGKPMHLEMIINFGLGKGSEYQAVSKYDKMIQIELQNDLQDISFYPEEGFPNCQICVSRLG